MNLEVQPPDGPAKKIRWVHYAILIVITVMVILLIAGCGMVDDYNDNHGIGDAPTGEKDDSEKDVIQFPDGFSNVAHGCDGHGHRVYVTTQNASGKEMVVVDDPTCPGGQG